MITHVCVQSKTDMRSEPLGQTVNLWSTQRLFSRAVYHLLYAIPIPRAQLYKICNIVGILSS